MIIGRQVKNVSNNTPTSAGGARLKNGSNLIRGWNRVRGSSIESNIHSSFINQAICLPLLSGGVESEVGVPFLVNWHLRHPSSKPEELGDSHLFLYVHLTQLQPLYWLKFSCHVPTTSIILNSCFLLS